MVVRQLAPGFADSTQHPVMCRTELDVGAFKRGATSCVLTGELLLPRISPDFAFGWSYNSCLLRLKLIHPARIRRQNSADRFGV